MTDASTELPPETPKRRSRRRWIIDIAVVGVGIVLGAVLFTTIQRDTDPPPLLAAVEPLLPDLTMGEITRLRPGDPEEGGRQPLLFPATIVNVGKGDFLVDAQRSWPWTGDWRVTQRIQDGTGGYSERPTTATLIYGGHGHSHWHVKAVEAHRVERVDTGEVVAEVVKVGFCFYDTDYLHPELPGAPTDERYDGHECEGPFTTGQVTGLSVGWGDQYTESLPDQRVYIEGLPAGRYRLHQIADPNDEFAELDETNNETWVEFDLTWAGATPGVAIVGHGPE
jgi:hypothetical protein